MVYCQENPRDLIETIQEKLGIEYDEMLEMLIAEVKEAYSLEPFQKDDVHPLTKAFSELEQYHKPNTDIFLLAR